MGLRTVLVSGRTYEQLIRFARSFEELDGIVAENGAVVEAPVGGPVRVVGHRTGRAVRRRLEEHSGLECEFGRVVVSIPRADQRRLLRATAGLRVDMIANVDRLMVLPVGVSKWTGLRIAMRQLGLSRTGFAAIGDAENDLALLRGARLSGAVANAVPAVRSAVDYVCRRSFEDGVLEFVRGPLRKRTGSGPDAADISVGPHAPGRGPP